VKDRGDELSTADLAGQSAGSGGGATVADERAQRGEDAQMGEGRTVPPADDPAADGSTRGVGGDPSGTSARSDRADFSGDRPGPDFGDATTERGAAGGMSGGGFADTTDRDRGAYADEAPGNRGEFADAAAQRDADASGDRGAFAGDATGRGVDADRTAGAEAVGDMSREPAGVTAGSGGGAESGAGPLLPPAESEGFRARWTDVQTGFVDAPRRAVEQADSLVAELMQHLAKTFADERTQLESQWDRGDDVPTDDLRTAFQRYRSFFERLLAT
jgi:hypothetical protein